MLTMAAFGIIALLAVGFIFKKLMASPVAEVTAPEPRVLPMAITAIEPGTVITAAHVGNGRASASQELKKDTFTSREGVIGRIAKVRIEAAVPLEGNMFYSIGDHPGLDVAPGMQAVTIDISETSSVLLQKLKSDQRVDVLLTVTGMGSGGIDRIQNTGTNQSSSLYTSLDDSMTVTLFKGCKVLAVHRGGSAATLVQSSMGSRVTLELDEDEARIVSLAQRKGEIDLVYTSLTEPSQGIDIEAEEANRITIREILGIEREKEKEKPFRTEHYRGGGRSSSYFEDGERLDGYGGGDGDGGGGAFGGSQIQNTGGGQDWSTDAKPTIRQQNVAQKPVAAGS
jgi:pilus assembly protein CpaB